jgi:hypothetical protein
MLANVQSRKKFFKDAELHITMNLYIYMIDRDLVISQVRGAKLQVSSYMSLSIRPSVTFERSRKDLPDAIRATAERRLSQKTLPTLPH